MLAQSGYTDFRQTPGLVTGVARGPGDTLVVGIGEGSGNGLSALVGW